MVAIQNSAVWPQLKLIRSDPLEVVHNLLGGLLPYPFKDRWLERTIGVQPRDRITAPVVDPRAEVADEVRVFFVGRSTKTP